MWNDLFAKSNNTDKYYQFIQIRCFRKYGTDFRRSSFRRSLWYNGNVGLITAICSTQLINVLIVTNYNIIRIKNKIYYSYKFQCLYFLILRYLVFAYWNCHFSSLLSNGISRFRNWSYYPELYYLMHKHICSTHLVFIRFALPARNHSIHWETETSVTLPQLQSRKVTLCYSLIHLRCDDVLTMVPQPFNQCDVDDDYDICPLTYECGHFLNWMANGFRFC